MRNRAAHIIGWATAAISLIVGFLGAAPITPAILLVAILLPVAALVAWRGAVVAGLLTLLLCMFALAISPLSMDGLFKVPFAMVWLMLWSAAVIFGVVHGIRINSKRYAK